MQNYILVVVVMHLITDFDVKVIDDAVGKCWTNADAVKTAVELILRQSGLKVVKEGMGRLHLQVNAFRLEISGLCSGTFHSTIEIPGIWETGEHGVVGSLVLKSTIGTLTNPENGNHQILEFAQDFARNTANMILKQRSEK